MFVFVQTERLPATELRKQLEDCTARYVVTVPDFLDKVHEACDGLSVRHIFVVGDAADGYPGASDAS